VRVWCKHVGEDTFPDFNDVAGGPPPSVRTSGFKHGRLFFERSRALQCPLKAAASTHHIKTPGGLLCYRVSYSRVIGEYMMELQ
jgi:hypothetical protein